MAVLGRNLMLLEAHLPDRGPAPVRGAGNLAAVLRTATEQAAREVRERKVPDWTPVRAALPPLDTPDSAAFFSRVTLLADALDELSDALRP